jgi:hypothetical protein
MATAAPEFEFLLLAALSAYQRGYRIEDDKGGDLSEYDTGRLAAKILHSGCVVNDLPVPETEEELDAVTDYIYALLDDYSTG